MHDSTAGLGGEPGAPDDLEGAFDDLSSTLPPVPGPYLARGYAWRCDDSGCPEIRSGNADRTDSGIKTCPVHGSVLKYRLP